MPNARVLADGGALPATEAIPTASFDLGGRSPLDIVTMPSGDQVQITLTALRRHTAALNALRVGAEAELTANVFARLELEALIERLIAVLDAADGDENLEPYLTASHEGRMDDREGDSSCLEDDEDDGTTEPSLGAPEGPPDTNRHLWMQGRSWVLGCSQEHWSQGCADDSEDEHDGREDGHDREHDEAERGLGDADAVALWFQDARSVGGVR